MSDRSEVIDAVQRAKTILKGMGAGSRSSQLGTVGQRAAQMFLVLDGLLAELPDPVPAMVLGEVERVVDALHAVDESWPGCGDREGQRLFELAGARLRRLVHGLAGG